MQTDIDRVPPLPSKLKVLLADYPEILQELQDALVDVMRSKSLEPPFEFALWRLEDILSHHMINAGAELRSAKEHGDPKAIEVATEKDRVMSRARSMNSGLSDLHELFDFFTENKDAWK
ncbi:hypothetical protein J2X52_001755 [Luteimonas sp. 3794]|nr:hypothetical protein [Luteimonas sp. 3794]